MNRRRFIITGTTVVPSIGIAGCTENNLNQEPDVNDESSTTSSGGEPGEVTKEFINMVNNKNYDTIDSLIHPNSKLVGKVDSYVADREMVNIKSVQIEAVTSTNKEAFVTADIRYSTENNGNSYCSVVYGLQKENNEWRIYTEPSHVLLEHRLEDVNSGNSFKTKIGTSESTAENFIRSEDIVILKIEEEYQDEIITRMPILCDEDRAKNIQKTVSDLGDDIRRPTVYVYLDDELIKSHDMNPMVATSMREGSWANQGNYAFWYEDKELAERIAATVLEHGNIN